MKRECTICGKKINIFPSEIKKGGGKYCSRKCMIIGRLGKKSHRWKGGLIKRNCIVCKKEIRVRLDKINKGYGKYCSLKCMGISKSKEKSILWKGGNSKRTCMVCGKEFSVSISKIKIGKGKYCSLKCMVIFRTKENSINWKGGISSTTHRIRESIKYQEWRQQVFIRDNFTCQKCNQRGGKLHAHHKKPFHKFIEEIKNNLPLFDLYEAAIMYTPLWDLDNGITLCEKCHKKIKRNHL